MKSADRLSQRFAANIAESMGATSAAASPVFRPSSTCTATTSAAPASYEYSFVANVPMRHAPNSLSYGQAVPTGAARITGAVAGESFTAWIASDDAPTSARAGCA